MGSGIIRGKRGRGGGVIDPRSAVRFGGPRIGFGGRKS
nr:MAG TPA: hypothetical protein [Caudoviricetes sp.]